MLPFVGYRFLREALARGKSCAGGFAVAICGAKT